MPLNLEEIHSSLKNQIVVRWDETILRTFCSRLFSRELKRIPKEISYEALLTLLEALEERIGKSLALSLLAKKAYLSSDLEKKLLSRGLSSSSIQRLITHCQQQGYLDDTALLQRLIAKEEKKGTSRKALLYKLHLQKKIPSQQIASLVDRFFSEEEALKHWLRKRAKTRPLTRPEECRKAAQALSRLGFSWDLIAKKLPLHE